MTEEAWTEVATEDEQLRLAQHFLLSSPPGQVHDVLRDVAKLVPARVLPDDALRGALHSYNIKHCVPVAVPDADYKILICEDAQVDATHYVDPIGRRVLGFDHIKQAVVPDDVSDLPPAFDSPFESERLLVEKALQSYIQYEYMHEGTVGVFVQGSTLIVNLCTERVNLRNFYSGRWQSRWQVALDATPRVEITGSMALHVHYFENGNLQLQCEKQVTPAEAETVEESAVPTLESSAALGDAIRKVIKETEDALQSNLEEMYINMSQETFKEMRRVMPVTQTKMEWSLRAHRTAKNLSRK